MPKDKDKEVPNPFVSTKNQPAEKVDLVTEPTAAGPDAVDLESSTNPENANLKHDHTHEKYSHGHAHDTVVKPLKPKDWEPPYMHIPASAVPVSSSVSGSVVTVTFDNDDDAKAFCDSVSTHVKEA